MRNYRNALLTFWGLMLLVVVKAGYITSVDMTYTCSGQDVYVFTIDMYTECGYEDFAPSTITQIPLQVSSSKLGEDFEVNLVKSGNGVEEFIFCKKLTTNCNGGEYRGLMKYTYIGVVSLRGYEKSDDWLISFQKAARSFELTGVKAPENKNYYTEALINNKDASCNNSPTFANSPIVRGLVGVDETYNLGVNDADGNRLEYAFSTPLTDAGLNLEYQGGASATKPVSMANPLQVVDGQIKYKVSTQDQISITDLIIKEYNADGKLIGSTRRGLQFNTFENLNIAPKVVRLGDENEEIEELSQAVCARNSIGPEGENRVRIKAYDLNSSDNITLEDISGLNLKWDVVEKTDKMQVWELVWKTTDADVGMHNIQLKVEDDGCPVKLNKVYTYELEILDIPKFSIPDINAKELTNETGSLLVMDCIDPESIAPPVSGGDGNYQYHWIYVSPENGDTTDLGTELQIQTKQPGLYELTVKDGKGCSNTLGGSGGGGFDIGWFHENYCDGDTTVFTDTSIATAGITITDWEWTIDDDVVLNDEVVKYAFPELEVNETSKMHIVNLTATNNLGCRIDKRDTIYSCAPPKLNIKQGTNRCSMDTKFADFFDNTEYDEHCGALWKKWKMRPLCSANPFGTVPVAPSFLDSIHYEMLTSFNGHENEIQFVVPDSGFYEVTLTVETQAGCSVVVIDTFWINQRPTVNFFDTDFVEMCNARDTVLHAAMSDTIGFPFRDAIRNRSYLLYSWITPNSNPLEALPDTLWDPFSTEYKGYDSFDSSRDLCSPARDSIFDPIKKPNARLDLPINLKKDGVGEYQLIVIGDSGCVHPQSLKVFFPLAPDFTYDIVCKLGDEMKFTNKSKLNSDAANLIAPETYDDYVVKHTWYFGDGDSSNIENPTHIYKVAGDYKVRLKITDKFSCEKEDTFTVYNSFYTVGNKGDDKLSFSPDLTKICANDEITVTGIKPVHHDYTFWKTSAKDSSSYCSTSWKRLHSSECQSSFNGGQLEKKFVYKDNEKYEFYTSVKYNAHKEAHDSVCSVDRKVSVDVKPEVEIDVSISRTCLHDDGLYTVQRINDEGLATLDSARWQFFHKTTGALIHEAEGLEITLKVDTAVVADVIVEVVDAIGCRKTGRSVLQVDSLTKARFEHVPTCANEKTPFTAWLPNRATWLRADKYYMVDAFDDTDTIMKGLVNIESFDTEASRVFLDSFIVFGVGGNRRVKLYLDDGQPSQCRSVLDTTIFIKGAPDIGFDTDAPEKCSEDDVVHFTFKHGELQETEIVGYKWEFNDGDTSSVRDPSYVYKEGGNHPVSVTAYTSDGCKSTLKDSLIYVKDKPKVVYNIDSDLLEKDIDLPFVDGTVIESNTSIKTVYYDFGDGTSSTDYNPIHSFDSIKIYTITYIVETEEGCRDTLITQLDLNTYLDIPTAFTPNDDDLNDVIGLINKSVKELIYFRIYNRWGELVFDANGDINATWDGTYKGEDQEYGVYVVHVKGRGAYNKEFDVKREITLIR